MAEQHPRPCSQINVVVVVEGGVVQNWFCDDDRVNLIVYDRDNERAGGADAAIAHYEPSPISDLDPEVAAAVAAELE